nr:hypothetical protein [uncultured Blautia sp.]
MRFRREVSIYAKESILKRFDALETDFKVAQGKISSLISESELLELQSGNKTMYSRMASTEQTVSGLSQKYTDLNTKYNTVSGQYTDMDSKLGEYKAAVDGFSVALTELHTHIEEDYSTTKAMEAAIKLSVDGLKTEISDTYITQDDLNGYSTVEQMSTAVEASTKKISAEVRDVSYYNYCTNSGFEDKEGWQYDATGLKTTTYLGKTCAILLASDDTMSKAGNSSFVTWKYSADEEQEDEITVELASLDAGNVKIYLDDTEILNISKDAITKAWKEFSIKATVEKGDHAIKIRVEDKEKRIYVTGTRILTKYGSWAEGRLSVLSNSFSTEIKRISEAEGALSTRIEQTKKEIDLKVSKNAIISEINQTAEAVSIKAAKIDFNGLVTANNRFKILTDGSFVANYGAIASWNVRNGSLVSTDAAISLYGGDNPYIKIGNVKISESSHAAIVKYGLWIYAGTDQDLTDGSDQLRFYNLGAITGNTLGIAPDKHVGTIASSSRRYKVPMGTVSLEEARKILNIPVVKFKYREGYLYKNDELYEKVIPGFYAEEVNNTLPLAAIHDEQGRPEDWNQRILIPLMIKLIQDMNERLQELEERKTS